MWECPAGLMILQNQPTAAPAFHGSVAGSGSGQIHMIHSMAGLRIRIPSDPYNLLHGRVAVRIWSDQYDFLHYRDADSDPIRSMRFTPWQGCGSESGRIHMIHSMTGLWIRIRLDPYDSLHGRVTDPNQIGSIWFTPWQGCGSRSGRIHMIHSMAGLRIRIRLNTSDVFHLYFTIRIHINPL